MSRALPDPARVLTPALRGPAKLAECGSARPLFLFIALGVAATILPASAAAQRADTYTPRIKLDENLCSAIVRQDSNELDGATQADLDQFGVVRSDVGFIFSEDIVRPECDRVRIAAYLSALVSGVKSEPLENFGRTHRMLIGRTVRSIWRIISADRWAYADGAFFSDVYSLLADENLPQSDFEVLAIEELTVHEIHGDLAYVLMARPTIGKDLRRTLLGQLALGGAAADSIRTGMTAGVLGRHGTYRTATLRKAIAANPPQTERLRTVLADLLSRLRNHERIAYEHIEDLGYLE